MTGKIIKVPTWLAPIAVAAIIGLQGWMLKEISALKANVAGLSARIEVLAGQSHYAQK